MTPFANPSIARSISQMNTYLIPIPFVRGGQQKGQVVGNRQVLPKSRKHQLLLMSVFWGQIAIGGERNDRLSNSASYPDTTVFCVCSIENGGEWGANGVYSA